ncbi:unnamed protein product [Caenorhabditis brenneri]
MMDLNPERSVRRQEKPKSKRLDVSRNMYRYIPEGIILNWAVPIGPSVWAKTKWRRRAHPEITEIRNDSNDEAEVAISEAKCRPVRTPLNQ